MRAAGALPTGMQGTPPLGVNGGHSPRMTVHATLAQLIQAFDHAPFRTGEAEAHGITGDRLLRAASTGMVRRLTRGTYVVPDDRGPDEQRIDAWRLAQARSRRVTSGGLTCVIGVDAAAQRWSVPLLQRATPMPTLILPKDAPCHTGTRGIIRVVREDLHPDDIHRVASGETVTSPIRTAIDVIRRHRLDPRAAAATLSIAQRRHIELASSATPYQLRALLADPDVRADVSTATRESLCRAPSRGKAHVRRAIDLCDPRLESVLEGVSWHDFIQAGLPLPTPQAWVQGASGKWYCVDFLWRDAHIIGEADGAVKYRTAAEVMAEKARQADLEAAGYRFVRWTWADAMGARTFLVRISMALDDAKPRIPSTKPGLRSS